MASRVSLPRRCAWRVVLCDGGSRLWPIHRLTWMSNGQETLYAGDMRPVVREKKGTTRGHGERLSCMPDSGWRHLACVWSQGAENQASILTWGDMLTPGPTFRTVCFDQSRLQCAHSRCLGHLLRVVMIVSILQGVGYLGRAKYSTLAMESAAHSLRYCQLGLAVGEVAEGEPFWPRAAWLVDRSMHRAARDRYGWQRPGARRWDVEAVLVLESQLILKAIQTRRLP